MLNDESFTLELLELIEHAQQQCRLFRLIDRIEQDMEFGRDAALRFGLEVDLKRCYKAGQSLRVHAQSLQERVERLCSSS